MEKIIERLIFNYIRRLESVLWDERDGENNRKTNS
jgi:hypothetical protein